MASLICLFAFVPFLWSVAEFRVKEDFDANWLFSKGDFASTMVPGFDDDYGGKFLEIYFQVRHSCGGLAAHR